MLYIPSSCRLYFVLMANNIVKQFLWLWLNINLAAFNQFLFFTYYMNVIRTMKLLQLTIFQLERGKLNYKYFFPTSTRDKPSCRNSASASYKGVEIQTLNFGSTSRKTGLYSWKNCKYLGKILNLSLMLNIFSLFCGN